MTTLVVTPPPAIVTVEDARVHLRVDGTDQDVEIASLVAVAQGTIDGPGGWLGRSLGEQVLEWQGAGFDPCQRLAYAPITAVQSVSYLDRAGGLQTLASSAWFLEAGRFVRPVPGWSAPATAARADAVRIRYTAGWPMDGETWTGPAPIRHAILMMVSRLYAARGEAVSANLVEDGTIKALLAPFRAWGP